MESEVTDAQFINQALRTKHAEAIALYQARIAQLDELKETLVMQLVAETGLDRDLIQDLFPKPATV